MGSNVAGYGDGEGNCIALLEVEVGIVVVAVGLSTGVDRGCQPGWIGTRGVYRN